MHPTWQILKNFREFDFVSRSKFSKSSIKVSVFSLTGLRLRDPRNLGTHLSFVYVICGMQQSCTPSHRLVTRFSVRVQRERLMHASRNERRPSSSINCFGRYYRPSRQVFLPRHYFTSLVQMIATHEFQSSSVSPFFGFPSQFYFGF